MDLLINPQTSYLLQADLASLHAESKSWLEEIEFWQDELAFFFKLLHSKLASDAFRSVDISGFDKQLISINSERGNLKEQVQRHERALETVLQSTSISDEDNYRIVHRNLHRKMVEMHAAVRNFKKEVYAFLQKYETK
jgi:hypothetical protein